MSLVLVILCKEEKLYDVDEGSDLSWSFSDSEMVAMAAEVIGWLVPTYNSQTNRVTKILCIL